MLDTPPYLEQKGHARYFHAAPDDTVYRIYDVTFIGHGRYRTHALMSKRAVSRLFRPRDGWWRIYDFRDGDRRDLDVMTLQTQLSRSAYLDRRPTDTTDFNPKPGHGPGA